MEISPLLLLWLLLASAVFGMAVGAVMDVNRLIRVCFGVRYSEKTFEKLYAKPLPIIRRPLKPQKQTRPKQVLLPILMFAQDIFLFVFAAVGTVILNYYFNQGRFRLYTVAAVAVGFVIYYFTIGRLVMLLSEGIVFLIRSVWTIFFVLISRPICVFVEFFRKNAKKMNENLQNAIAKKRKRVYNKRKQMRMMQEAEKGFLHEHV